MKEELKMSKNWKDIDNKTFVKFLKIVIYLQNALDYHDEIDKSLDKELQEFCRKECADCANFDDIKSEFKDTEIKSNRKYQKFQNLHFKLTHSFIIRSWIFYPTLNTEIIF